MSFRSLLFLLAVFAWPLTTFADTSYQINLLENQKWKIEVTSEERTALDTQAVFEISRDGEAFTVTPYEVDLKTGIKAKSIADYDTEYIKRDTEPEDIYLQLRYCWYKYAPIQVGLSCHFFRIPIVIRQELVQGDDSFDFTLVSTHDMFKVMVLKKDNKEVPCTFRGNTHKGHKLYFSKESTEFEKLKTFACFETEAAAKIAGYQLNFAEGGPVIADEDTGNVQPEMDQKVTTLIAPRFPDVSAIHPNYSAITFLRSHGVIGGYSNGRFGPDDLVTRVQALKILLLGSKIDPANDLHSAFPDVALDHWGQRFIAEASKRGIVQGDLDGNFRPDAPLNMAEALKMLLKTNGVVPAAPVDNPSAWYSPFVAYAKEKGLVDAVGSLHPGKQLTRGELAELMYRLMYIQENRLTVFSKLLIEP